MTPDPLKPSELAPHDDGTTMEEAEVHPPGDVYEEGEENADASVDDPGNADSGAFWSCGSEFEGITIEIAGAERPLALLEKLGPSPFERGGFPLIGFLATTYDKVTRHTLELP